MGEFGESERIHQNFSSLKFASKNCRKLITEKIFMGQKCVRCLLSWNTSSCEAETESPRSQWPVKGTVLPTAIAAANVKVTEPLNKAEAKKSVSKACGAYSLLMSVSAELQSREKSNWEWRSNHNLPLQEYPDLVLKESNVCRFKNACQQRIKLNID